MEEGTLTPEEEIQQMIQRFDIPVIREALEEQKSHGLMAEIAEIFETKEYKSRENQGRQLKLIEEVINQFYDESSEERAYILLGALEYAQQRWGKFPNTGPMFDLTLKLDDLVQVISENSKEVQLKELFNNPNLILEHGEKSFLEFTKRNLHIHDLLELI